MKRLGFWTPALLAGGALHTASFAPLEWWPLQILAVALLAAGVQGAAPRLAAWRGFVFGFAWLSSGLWWLYISMHEYGGMPALLAAPAVALLAAALSLYLAGAMALVAWCRPTSPTATALAFTGAWLLAELARAQWLTGFPWIASGYAHSSGPLAGLAPWIGVYGIGAVAALLAATLAACLRPVAGAGRPWALLALALLLPGLPALAPREFTVSTGTLHMSLLQPNVPQDLKFDPDRIAADMAALQVQLHAARGQLVVTPESVLPVPRDRLDEGYWQQLTAPFRAGGRAALIGTFLGNDNDGYVNSVVGVSPAGGDGYTYGKRHLLPFGEFVPPGFRWFVDLMQIPLGDQARGHREAPFTVGAQRLRPLVCYENLFGEDMAASVGEGPQAATILVNVSNLAWFGRWMVQDQDLQFSRLRALEFQRPLVRATNTGSTAVVDHRGVVTARLPAETQATLDVAVEGRRGATPYARWLGAAGLWPLWAVALACVMAAVAARAAPWRRRGPGG
ncbi:apolipoprotein N-acyltransferase [Ideonella sp.]|uniref:apolipoprotein N-acyltransferase n=1 Tax=Ideonella sp. TaxID=1929293 RepID=UPI002B4921B8|nr:apolipoprotein N-acyltransferase [Ideonella sp.]HJV69839.1 apolipoprotein N-acyltransferase [Ideonella sp.]